jgi:beta-phosphoglucomutase-like phosphatase (HAD superfamily)
LTEFLAENLASNLCLAIDILVSNPVMLETATLNVTKLAKKFEMIVDILVMPLAMGKPHVQVRILAWKKLN